MLKNVLKLTPITFPRQAIRACSLNMKGERMKLKEVIDYLLELIWGKKSKPKRARNSKGQFVGDDKSTKGKNEAWVGGKAPKKRKK